MSHRIEADPASAHPPRAVSVRPVSGQRIAVRIARRTSVRSIGRSLLIGLLIALPIAGLSAVVLVARSTDPTPAETVATQLGRSEARLRVVSPPDPGLSQYPTDPDWWQNGEKFSNDTRDLTNTELADPTSYLPAGTRVLTTFPAAATVTTAHGVASLPVIEGEPWDAALHGHFEVLEGRVPRVDSEIMVTPGALTRLGARLGDTVAEHTPLERTVTIVGVLDDRTKGSANSTLFALPGALVTASGGDRIAGTSYYLPALPLDWDAVQGLNRHGVTVLSRQVLLDPPPPGSGTPGYAHPNWFVILLAPTALIAAFTVFEVVLLAGAAFAVGARQQQRTLAIVASVGAPRSVLFRIVSANGIVLGTLGGLLGLALGISCGSLAMALTGDGSTTRYYGYHLDWPILAGILVFAVVVGWISALAPAIAASRLDVVGALRGARRPPTPSRRRPIVGVIVVLVGTGLAVVGGILLVIEARASHTISGNGGRTAALLTGLVVAGPIVVQVGLALCGPLLLRGAAAAFSRSGLGSRLALRDAARNPGRAVPAFAAILTAVFVAVFAMCVVGSSQVQSDAGHQYTTMPGQVSSQLDYAAMPDRMRYVTAPSGPFVAALRSTLPVKTVRTLSSVPDFDIGPDQIAAKVPSLPSYPVLTVPAANLCPMDARSPQYSEKRLLDPAFATASQNDRRCSTNTFLSSAHNAGGRLWVGSIDDLALVLGRQPSPSARTAFAAGHAVALYPEYVSGGEIELDWWTAKQLADDAIYSSNKKPVSVTHLDAVVDSPAHPINFGVFVPTATADRLGLPSASSLVLASLTRPPSTGELDAARQDTAALTGDPDGSTLSIETGPAPFANLVAWILLGLSSLVAVGSSAVAIGLARAEGRQDDATLGSLGASSITRRSFAFWQSLLLSGLGAVLGAAVGLLPALALELPGGRAPFAPPWLQIGLTAVGLPLTIACGSWLMASSRGRPVLRRTPIG